MTLQKLGVYVQLSDTPWYNRTWNHQPKLTKVGISYQIPYIKKLAKLV